MSAATSRANQQWLIEKNRSMRQGLVAGFAKMKTCVDKFRPNTSQANCFEGFWRTTNKIKAKIEVRKQKKSLRGIHQAGYVCHTSSANAMYSFSLSLLPSKHCLFWCLLSASICLLVLTRYFDEKLRNKASFGSRQSRTCDTEVSSFIILIKSHLHNLTASENMNLKKIPVDHYHDANQYSVAALARPQEKKVTLKNWKKVLPYTICRSESNIETVSNAYWAIISCGLFLKEFDSRCS